MKKNNLIALISIPTSIAICSLGIVTASLQAQTPKPTNTPKPVPTNTTKPTNTPKPVPTNTTKPTNTPKPVPTNTPNPTNTKVNPNSWQNFSTIEQGFMQGCMGQASLTAKQKKIKQDFCQCAFTSYQSRYSPQVFIQINELAVKIGESGPSLVNLMMKPEMDTCMRRTGFTP